MSQSPFLYMKENSKTVLWNDSADPKELTDALNWGIVGATCNPVIALTAIKADAPHWVERVQGSQIGQGWSGDVLVVGGDHDAVEAAGRLRGLDRPADDGFAEERLDVLARNALATAASWDDRQFHAAIALCTATMTSSCWASVMVWYIGRLMASA